MVSETIQLLNLYLPPLIPALMMLIIGFRYVRRLEHKIDDGLEEIQGTMGGITTKGIEYMENFRKDLPENMHQLTGSLMAEYGPKFSQEITNGMESLFKRTIGQLGGVAKGANSEIISAIPGGKVLSGIGKKFGLSGSDALELFQLYQQFKGGGDGKEPISTDQGMLPLR